MSAQTAVLRGARIRAWLVVVPAEGLAVLGLAMDAIDRWRVQGTFHPGEMVLVARLLAFASYLPLCRIARLAPAPPGTMGDVP